MGYYINVPAGAMASAPGAKEKWLREHGELYGGMPPAVFPVPNKVLVCLINNGLFSAAAIVYDMREYKEFSAVYDRPKQWYLVDKAKVLEVCPQVKHKLEG